MPREEKQIAGNSFSLPLCCCGARIMAFLSDQLRAGQQEAALCPSHEHRCEERRKRMREIPKVMMGNRR